MESINRRLYSVDAQSTTFDIYRKYHWNVTDPLIGIEPVFGRKMPAWKRVMDISSSIIGIIFFFPFILLIAVLIKMVSPGPIFFLQKRVGYGGKMFTMFKLRTMAHNTDTSIHKEYLKRLIKADENDTESSSTRIMKKLEKDSRVIPFGNLLRSSGIDELPQLINVLLGDMSLIGPRPPIPYEVNQYKNWFSDRFDIVPGITGLWQVRGKNNLTFYEMIRLDIQYIRNMSFWLDLKILLLTPAAIVGIIKENYKNT